MTPPTANGGHLISAHFTRSAIQASVISNSPAALPSPEPKLDKSAGEEKSAHEITVRRTSFYSNSPYGIGKQTQ